ncbi:MAG TPA: ParB/RepB/Spo0J family partition protein, partial [Candidatus Sumerlaeota bacterium]|nr:ParB/RepB/Spo0J family partition protein [Candidatus Sumerlaeota bacterium]
KIGKAQSIPLDRLSPKRANRKPGGIEDLRSLAASIAAVGLFYPIIVEPDPDQAGSYRIVAGERRWRALRLLKIETAPCVIVPTGTEAPDPEILRVVENHQRRNLEPLEEAAAIRTLLDSGLPVEVVAHSLGRNRAWIARRSSLTDLSERWVQQTRDKENKISLWPPSHLEMVSRFPREVQDQMLDRMESTWQRHFPTVEDLKSVSGDYLRLLSGAPWKLEDDTLRPLAGACASCDKRSSHTPDLFSGELGPSNERPVPGDHCLDPVCWREKAILFLKRKMESLSQVRPDLLLLNTAEHTHLCALEEIFGRRVENAWEVTMGRKTDDRAVPALIVNGAGLGRLKWVIPFENTPDTRHRETVPAAPEEVRERTLEEKKEPYDKRRRQLVIDAVRDRIQAVVFRQNPEDEDWKALTARGLLGKTLFFLSA